ncbi:MAG: metallophosphoesterase [Clostridiales bacterium]|nr:metallophosphoesterase [Clostridiales bacterium]
MATFLKGDIHGNLFEIIDFINRFNLGKNDNIIILGDCGIAWRKDKKDLIQNIKLWNECGNGVKLYFIDGNHENFNILNSLPIENNMGKIADNIYHLRRGQVYEFENKKILVCGGADSIDKYRRIENFTWWKEETISQETIDDIPAGHYDYVLTHCCPRSVFEKNRIYLSTLQFLDENKINHSSEDMLEQLKNKITFDHFYFGHYHIDRVLDDKFRCLFNDFVEME